jgi:hypothetical protein
VLFVVVLFPAVKFWRVVEPLTRRFCAESAPMEPVCAERLVEDAFVAKVLVEVLLVMVAFVPKRFVKVPSVALKIEAKKLVLVAAVVVEFVTVRRLN